MANNKNDYILDASITLGKMNQSANDKLGITQEYNKENRDILWDSSKNKSAFKDKVFDDKQTYKDPVTDKVLHKNQNAAQNKYHMKNKNGENTSKSWSKHSSETDHINSIKSVHSKVKRNPFLTDNDLNEIVNNKDNYRITSKSYNCSKGEKSDFQEIFNKNSKISKEGKSHILKEKVVSDIVLSTKFTSRTAKNMGSEFVCGSKDTLLTSVIPLTSKAIEKLVNVSSGEENFKEAMNDMSKSTIKVAIEGGKNKVMLDAITVHMGNSKIKALNSIANSNRLNEIILLATTVQETAVKYINGEINEKEFIDQIGEKGSIMMASMIGGQVGREIGEFIGGLIGTTILPGVGTGIGYVTGNVIGQLLGTIITTVACSGIISIYNTKKHLNDYKLKEYQIKRLEAEALSEISNQRTIFKNIVEREYHYWDNEIQDGFNMILTGVCKEMFDLQGVTDGIDKILSIFGRQVKFKTLDEYEQQLDQPLKLTF